MAVVDKEELEQAKRKAVSSTKKNEPVKRARSEPVKKPKKAPVSGLELLRREADRRLRHNIEEIADLLVKSAKAGKLDNTKFLVALAEKKKPDSPVKDARASAWVLQLETEPRYVFPREEGLAEVGEGGVETEW